MGLLDVQKTIKTDLEAVGPNNKDISVDSYWKRYESSNYQPTDEEKKVRAMVIRHFVLGDLTMQKPRVEFNDLSVIGRTQYDRMAWNTYQPNNGNALEGDVVNAWRSRAIRPIVRNKCVSIAAHATARLLFPKIFAWNDADEVQSKAALVMEDLMEWAGDQSNYAKNALYRVINALVEPASIGYAEYADAYRTIREVDDNGKQTLKKVCDEELSGFKNTIVRPEELFIENFYEEDIQKQGWLIWRRVRSYDLLESVYGEFDNFKFVKPGVQIIYNDANQSFYAIYDSNLRQEMCEEVIYWNRRMDLRITMVNGVMISKADCPNPRADKLYPFDKFGYELISSHCFYYKSLAFKLQQDANIVNTLYPMIIDGTYLNIMPPMINRGGEAIMSDVIVPGSVTTFSSPDANLVPISTANPATLKTGMDTLFKVDDSVNQSSQEPIQQGLGSQGSQTAYEISRLEQNANTVLGLFVKMISQHVKDYGRLLLGDIIQFMTLADVDSLEDDPELVYKTFFVQNKDSSKQISFKPTKENSTQDELLNKSLSLLAKQGGETSGTSIREVNPILFRQLKYKVCINPDVLNPKSEDLEKAFDLEEYDRLVANPNVNQEEALRFLLGIYPKTRKDKDKYIMQQQPQVAGLPMPGQKPDSPLGAMANKQALPQTAMAMKV